jgi:hypothetical protein
VSPRGSPVGGWPKRWIAAIRSRPALARGIALAIAALVVLFALHTRRRVEHQAAFCTSSCHHRDAHAGSGALSAAHAGVECQSCHHLGRGVATKLWWQSLIGSKSPVKHGAVDSATCLSCHERSPAAWRLVAATQGHREHHDVKNVDCLSCHKSEAHGSEPPEKVCTTCHANQHLHKATTTGAETCLSCHNFIASPKRVSAPTPVTCETCHADRAKLVASADGVDVSKMKTVNAQALHGKVACQLCHNAHGKKPVAPPGQPVCARCHQFENFQIGSRVVKGPEGHRNCEGCHKPHAPLKSALRQCVRCHEKNARGLVAKMPGAAGNTTALKHDACTSCHLPHTWKAERSGCMQCHKKQAFLLQTRSPKQHETCTTCHDVHGPPPTGAICLKCHSDTKGQHVRLAPEKHKDCTSCHNPHAPKPEDTRTSCAKCHATQVTQVVRDGPEGHAKDSCFGCHEPHNNPLPPPNICAKCHKERAAVVASAAPPKHRLCLSCHQVHVFKIKDIAPVCARCHGPMFPSASLGVAIPTKVPHQGPCNKCHQIHGSPGVPQTRCFQCHKDVAAEFHPPNAKHAVCRSCHQPHKPAALARAACAKCHQDKAAIATKWPVGSPHEKQCNLCHQQHDVRIKKACTSCHIKEATSAMGGRHQCTQCHAPHQAPPGFGAAWWTRCQQCHADKVESVKLRGPTHSKCSNCHKPHRFAKPACTSCHNDMASKGLHSVAQHAANCTSCHDPHVKSLPTRAQCLKCHTDRVSHQPNAVQCQACHMFR